MKPINILFKSYTSDCGDGCCWELRDKLFIDGVQLDDIASFGREEAIHAILAHLGYEVTIDFDSEENEP